MKSLRRRIGAWTAWWLVCEAAFLLALLPPDCCRTRQAVAASESRACHHQASTPTCPMHRTAPDCPMHRDGGEAGSCGMRGTCNGPLTAVVVLFSEPGLAPASGLVLPDDPRASNAISVHESDPVGRLTTPQSPPPRA